MCVCALDGEWFWSVANKQRAHIKYRCFIVVLSILPGSCHYTDAWIFHQFHHPSLLIPSQYFFHSHFVGNLLVLEMALRPYQPKIDLNFHLGIFMFKTHIVETVLTKRKGKRKDHHVRDASIHPVIYGFHRCIPVNPLFRQWRWVLWRWNVGGYCSLQMCVIFTSHSTGTIIIVHRI